MAKMGHAPDHGLPEVVPDTSTPQALTYLEVQYKQREMSERDKYHVVYDTAPMMPDGTYLHHPQSAMSPTGSVPWDSFPVGDGSSGPDGSSESQELKKERTVCGFRRKTFFLILVAGLIIVAGAIGGGVGGGLAAARARERSGDTAIPGSTDPKGTPTISGSPSTTQTTGVVPTTTFLNNQTGPVGFGFQGWSEPNYKGKMTPILTEEGFYDLDIDCLSYVWLPNATQCCVTFCADKHNATGWRCDARKRQQASGSFSRVYIWCDQDILTTHANATCS